MNKAIVFFLLLIPFAAESQIMSRGKRSFDPAVSVGLTNDFNHKDWYTGFSAGLEDRGYEWGARIGFCLRPFYKRTQVTDGYMTMQYREQKYFLSLEADKRFIRFRTGENAYLQLFAGAKGGFLFGNYRGTRHDAKPFALAAPMGGVCYNRGDAFMLKAGYCLFNDRDREIPDSRITLTLLFVI